MFKEIKQSINWEPETIMNGQAALTFTQMEILEQDTNTHMYTHTFLINGGVRHQIQQI